MLFKKEKVDYTNDYKVINNMRSLAIDMIDEAKSGHPGICLGAASILYTLYSKHLSFNRNDENWYNRDRFILSAGHGAPLFYALLYMLGKIPIEEVKSLRKLNSLTPGHPELITPMVDMATGPLGQGIAGGVGMAIAERYLNASYGNLVNHYTYVLCGDGDLEEGISYEALALAAKLKLNKLILLYDKNDVTLDGNLSLSSEEDVITRFRALNFNIWTVDGDNVGEINKALVQARNSLVPTIIICKTVIGKYSNLEGTNKVHGKPLEREDITKIKAKLDVYDSPFIVSQDAIDFLQKTIDDRMKQPLRDWQRKYDNLKENEREKLDQVFSLDSTYAIPNMDFTYENLSLREISGNILNAISDHFPLLIGGSADLSSSCKTYLKDKDVFSPQNYRGRNIYFGIREHAMGGILNGMALSGLRPFGSTFLVFSDYLRPAIRMSALMNLPVFYIFTHDAFTVGEDGMTHEPVEQLASLELIPNLYVYRPFDVNELLSCYMDILKNKKPSVLILPRDNKGISELTKNNKIEDGAYIFKENETDTFITLLANGEELGVVYEVSNNLNAQGFDTRIISIPCYQNFLDQGDFTIIPKDNVIGITYGVSDYFYRFTDKVIGLNTFGKSASKEDLLTYFGYDVESLTNKILELIKEEK